MLDGPEAASLFRKKHAVVFVVNIADMRTLDPVTTKWLHVARFNKEPRTRFFMVATKMDDDGRRWTVRQWTKMDGNGQRQLLTRPDGTYIPTAYSREYRHTRRG